MANLFDFGLVFTQIPDLLQYLPITLELALVALVIGLVLGLVIAIIRINNIPVLSQLAVFFISFVRGTPILVQLYLSYFGIPLILKYFNYYNGTDYNLNNIPGIVFAMIALGLNQSAFDAETIRSAIQSVDRGQIEAGKSLGMTPLQILKRILIPQAGAVALVPLGNSIIGLIKGTSLAFTCSVVELTARGKILAGRNYRYFEVYCSLAIIYWCITILLERLMKWVEIKVAVPEDVPEFDENGKPVKKKTRSANIKSARKGAVK